MDSIYLTNAPLKRWCELFIKLFTFSKPTKSMLHSHYIQVLEIKHETIGNPLST